MKTVQSYLPYPLRNHFKLMKILPCGFSLKAELINIHSDSAWVSDPHQKPGVWLDPVSIARFKIPLK